MKNRAVPMFVGNHIVQTSIFTYLCVTTFFCGFWPAFAEYRVGKNRNDACGFTVMSRVARGPGKKC